ncbi:MAG: sugar ABC transporter substrate-binding protein [Anaerolineae bacterium]|nr:sugar ABC transporter substrate-binding protein [Anaerolineae bacterium]
MFKKALLLVMLVALVAMGISVQPAKAAVTELTIFWAQWAPADYLQALVKDYETEKGIKVTVRQEPWGTFGNVVTTDWAAKATSWDLVVGDSQWLGQGASQGHYVELTDFMKSKGIDKTVTPATLQYYGEYPAGSGKYWGYPTEGDANGWAYRTDLFTDPKEMADFKAKYGYDLAVPETWDQLMDIAKFFTRKDQNLYGAAIYTQKDYDAITMGFENVFFSYGGDWYNKDFQVDGVVNSENAIKALQYYHDLYECCSPPGLSNAFFQETNDAYTSGQAAMVMNYFAFFPALANEASSKFAKTTGYFPMPKGPDGARFAALGGQGMSVSSYISDERKQAAMDFIEWFAQESVQAKWAQLGGYTCNINVLASPEFNKVAPFNAAFAETMNFVKDFTNIPEYGAMLPIVQEALHNFIVGNQGTAKEALDSVVEGWTPILQDAGYLK